MNENEKLLEAFRSYLTDEKKVSANTLESYMRDMNSFRSFLEADSPDVRLTSATEADIERYIAFLKDHGKSNATVIRGIASMRNFYQYLMQHDLCSYNPARSIKAERDDKKLPQILTNTEIDMLLDSPDIATPKGCRDKAMLELLYATGIRVSELINLNVDDVNLQLGMLNCHSDRNQRFIPIYSEAIGALSDYLYRVRPLIVSDRTNKNLFVNLNGKRLTRQGFWKIIKYYAERTGIKKDITPHTLRHSFAAHLFENGAQLKDIKDMLGHADISSTQVYAQLAKNKYKDVYNKYHPRAHSS